MFNYSINWGKVIMENLPAMLRTFFRYSRIRASIKPVITTHSEFLDFTAQSRYEASYNGGIISLETALNDRFDFIPRRIYITNAFYSKVFVYGKTELKTNPVLYPKWSASPVYPANSYVWHLGNVYKSGY